jgi:hypothetical protein
LPSLNSKYTEELRERTVRKKSMETRSVKEIVDEINTFIRSKPWLDMEIRKLVGNESAVIRSIDQSNPHDLEIIFKEICLLSLPMEWKTDTSTTVFELLEGEDSRTVNKVFQVERGHHIFRERMVNCVNGNNLQ